MGDRSLSQAAEAKRNAPQLMSGNDAVARGVWEAGVRVAAAYPGTPSTEILESLSRYPDIHANWAVNEKVSLEIAIGAAVSGSRAFAAMKHVGVNVASDALMSQTLAGTSGGLVIAIADDVGLSSSQNEQDSRYWGRFGHLPILEPCDSQEALEMTRFAFELSEKFETPVILRITTRVSHVKSVVTVGEREVHAATGFEKNPARWVLVPAIAKRRLGDQFARDKVLAEYAEGCDLNRIDEGSDKRVGFVTSGPAYSHLKEAFPDAPVFKLGLSYPLPFARIAEFAKTVDAVIVAEETEPLIEKELKAAGIAVHGKDILPATDELTPNVVGPAVKGFLGEAVEEKDLLKPEVFPRPPTMCVGCPHLSVYYCLSRLKKKVNIAGDIGCYTLGAGHPWNALDTCTCMGGSMGMALGMDLGRADADKDKGIVAVIGDSTFLHMGMQGLLNIVYEQGNVTVLLMDNGATGMTGGQDHPGTGADIRGDTAPRVDFAKLVAALGVKDERIRVVDPGNMPDLFKTLKAEIATPEPSVIITNRPCTLIDCFCKDKPFAVDEDACTGCTNCLNVGCPAILVTRTGIEKSPKGKDIERKWVRIDTAACTGCGLCPDTCGPGAIQLAEKVVAGPGAGV
jgi:indolepyruvate ferredoxin oxidoreductase, alpha subunit